MEPILKGRNLVKRYGRVVALDNCDFDLHHGEILGVIGDNGAGKSTLIKAVSGAVTPDEGKIWLEGKEIRFTSPLDGRHAGIETVYQTLAMSPALSITDNMFMGRELRKPGFLGSVMRQLDHKAMDAFAREKLNELGLMTIQNINQAVETLSGGQRDHEPPAPPCPGKGGVRKIGGVVPETHHRFQAAMASCGGSLAPVMKATASDMVKSFGLMTQSRLPSR